MAGRQPEEEPPRGRFVCKFCNEVWPSARALAGHIKAHKGKAPAAQEPIPSVPPPAFGPPAGLRLMPVMPSPQLVVPPLLLPPPRPVRALGLGQPVAVPAAAARFFFGGGGQPCMQVAHSPLRDPVVYEAGGTIRLVLLLPNPAFWAPYRMGMAPPEELDLLGPRSRPESPSPSFAGWLNNA